MKVIITLILSAFLLTSCSNPDTSGGVTLHKFGWWAGQLLFMGTVGPSVPRKNLSLTLPQLRTNFPMVFVLGRPN